MATFGKCFHRTARRVGKRWSNCLCHRSAIEPDQRIAFWRSPGNPGAAADKLTTGVDTEQAGVHRTRKVELCYDAVVANEPVICEHVTVGVDQIPVTDDCPRFINPQSVGIARSGEINCGYYSTAEQETMCESDSVDNLAHNVATVVDLECLAVVCAEDSCACKRNEIAFFDRQRMTGRRKTVRTNNLSMIVDSSSCG